MPTGGMSVVRGLEAGRVECAFGIPAVHNLPIYDALYSSSSMRHITVKHEQAAGFMAIGYAYASGRPAACIVGCGPGATNMLTPAGEAFLNSAPMVIVAGGVRTTSVGKGGLHDIDQLSMFRSVTKRSIRLTIPSTLERDALQAVSASVDGRPRPVFLEVPFDILSSETTCGAESTLSSENGPRPEHTPVETGSISRIARTILESKRPLIIAGGGINSAGAWSELSALVTILSAPVASTISAKGAFPEDSPLSAGQLWDSVALDAASDADVVLALGCRFSERSTASWGLRFSGSLIQIDIDQDEIGRNYPVTAGVNADLKHFLRALLAELSERPSPDRRRWAKRIELARAERRATVRAQSPNHAGVLNPQEIMQEIASALPADSVVVAETGHAFWWSAMMLEIKRPRSFLAPAGNSTLGFGFPAALGAKCAAPDKPVLCLVGDGGFLFSCQEIITSVEERLPLVTVVFDDGGYAAIREYQRKGYGSRYIGVDFDVRPDLVKLAESLGAEGVELESRDEIAPTIAKAFRRAKTVIIDIKIDRREDVLPKFFTEIYRQGR